ncbi:MAG: glycosyltransferase [Flavobacteriaceae bacterium]
MSFFDAVLYAFIVTVCIQSVYYLLIFSRFAFAKESNPSLKNIPISVVVCAKNEAENLSRLIPKLLEQNYKQFEIVLINDASSDETLEVMEFFKENHSNIKIVNIVNNEAFWGNKKYALTLGIKAASNNFLLFTDADCVPNSKDWVASMSSHFTNKKSIVIGYGAYDVQPKSFLNKLIRFETLLTAIQYFSYAKIGLPYMAVGRNLAYRKELFFEANGFINHLKIRSGDDDLFVNEVATGKNTSICFAKNSFTTSQPKTTFKEWFNQKRRHVSTAKHYKFKHKALLTIFYVSQILFWILSIILLIATFKPILVISLMTFRLIIFYVVINYSSKKLEETGLILLLPFIELFLIATQFSIFISNLISKPSHWK